jgi:hypothetical protein
LDQFAVAVAQTDQPVSKRIQGLLTIARVRDE